MSDPPTLTPRKPGSIVRLEKTDAQEDQASNVLITKEVSHKEKEMMEWNTAEERDKGNAQ